VEGSSILRLEERKGFSCNVLLRTLCTGLAKRDGGGGAAAN
jgi:hypothetical protein